MVDFRRSRERLVFELLLIVVTIGTGVLFFRLGGYGLVALNLFYLPIVLSGYFLGRTNAGVLALLSALTVTIAAIASPHKWFAAFDTPVMMGLALVTWSAVLGLTAILVGTLCDERAATVRELQRAYVGVAEVLSKYLQGNHPRLKSRTQRIAQLSAQVAQEMRLPKKEIDHVHVAALLHDLANVEITTHVLSKAADLLGTQPAPELRSTFPGTDLVNSLGSVLEGALPLLVNQDDAVCDFLSEHGAAHGTEIPLGARIIRVARQYDQLVHGTSEGGPAPAAAMARLRAELGESCPHVIEALERVVARAPEATRFQEHPLLSW